MRPLAKGFKAILLGAAALSGLAAKPDLPRLTLTGPRRPAWVERDGIVMAGNWEPLPFRVRRDGAPNYQPSPEQRAAYNREHSPETIARLKALGVNFVLMHGYKGAGLEAERASMADAAKFARLCHDSGLRVGAYCDSGTVLWDSLFAETPAAKDWLLLGPDEKPLIYGRAPYRYYWNRNHPDGQAFYRQIIRFAVEDMQVDLIHLDNYVRGPGYDPDSVARFRRYLAGKFTAEQLRQNGIGDLASVRPPKVVKPNLLGRAWADFCCQSLAEAYRAMGTYARSLRSDVLMECNPGGVTSTLRWAVDPARMLPGGEAFWDEGIRPGYSRGQLHTRIRTYKAARLLGNAAFTYVTTPLEAAEAMAFNLDCLGTVCGFEYGEIKQSPDDAVPVLKTLPPYIRFFHERRDLLRSAQVVADYGVLRSFPSMEFAPPEMARLTGAVEDTLIAQCSAFQLVFQPQWDDLSRWPVLVLPGTIALSDGAVGQIRKYVAGGGRLCVIGPAATHDEWMIPRPHPALADLPAEQVIHVEPDGDWPAALRRACGGHCSLAVTGPDGTAIAGLAAELTEQPGRRLVHLVNYRPERVVKEATVRVALPVGRAAVAVVLVSPDHTDRSVPFLRYPGGVSFTVPEMGVYEIGVVTLR